MNENNIIQLLDEVKKIVIRNHAESFRQGKEFNIFYIQGIASDEVRVCRFMKELLDPKGSHGQGDIFLRRFMTDVLKTDDFFSDAEYRNARVTQEELTDNGRRIDLVIHIKGHRLFPVEVKIYASDQTDQCCDYYRYARSLDPETKIYYLTLDGHEPSDESKRDLQPGQFECLSFSDDILTWLDDCLNASGLERIYSVRELLIQFRDVIRKLTGRQKGKMMDEIRETITASYENVMAAVQVSKVLPDIKIEKMREVFTGIKSHMASHGFTESTDNYLPRSEDYYRKGKYTWPSINFILHTSDKEVEGKIALRFEIGDTLYIGITPWYSDNNAGGEKRQSIEDYVKNNLKPADTELLKKNKYWYWTKNLHEACLVQFMSENDEYYKLYDKKGFEDYMNGVCFSIDSILHSIKLIDGK